MKKLMIVIMSILFLLFGSVYVLAYTSCTPSSNCPAGYTDNGTICNGKICYRQCYILTCGNASTATWTQVFSDANKPHIKDQTDFDVSDSLGYTPTDSSKCYKFEYKGTSPSGSCIQMNFNESQNPPANCDTESVVGFRDITNTENPWYANIETANEVRGPKYLGFVNKAQFNYMLKVARSHADGEGTAQPYKDDLALPNIVYCANATAICDALAQRPTNCTTACYNRETQLRGFQGALNETGSTSDDTLYAGKGCGIRIVDAGNGNYFTVKSTEGCSGGYYVYSTPANITKYDTSAQCDMINEAPNITGVKVLPLTPNAGQDLICNYTYYDIENFTEQNSSYEWWKNNVNQNISSQILSYNNLTPNDVWFCKVSGSDGDKTSAFVQSSNNVTITSTVQNPTFNVNVTQAWNQIGYYGISKLIRFDSQLQSALGNCTQDEFGYCNISLMFYSNSTGILNLTNINIYHENTSTNEANLTIDKLQELRVVGKDVVYEIQILNGRSTTLENINWSLNISNVITYASYLSNLTSNESLYVYFQHNYSSFGEFNVTVTAFNQNYNATKNLTSIIKAIEITGLKVLNSSGTIRQFEFLIKNRFNFTTSNISFILSTGISNVLSSLAINLTDTETIYVFTDYNYTSNGTYIVNATARNETYQDSQIINITV